MNGKMEEIRLRIHIENLEKAIRELLIYTEEHGKILLAHKHYSELVAHVHKALNDPLINRGWLK